MFYIFCNQNIYMLIIMNEFVHVYYDTKFGFMLSSYTYIVRLKQINYRNNIYIFRLITNSLSTFMKLILVSYILYQLWFWIDLTKLLSSYIKIVVMFCIFRIRNIYIHILINNFVDKHGYQFWFEFGHYQQYKNIYHITTNTLLIWILVPHYHIQKDNYRSIHLLWKDKLLFDTKTLCFYYYWFYCIYIYIYIYSLTYANYNCSQSCTRLSAVNCCNLNYSATTKNC